MNKTNKILLAVVVLLVLIFGVGQFFTSSVVSSPSTSSSNNSAGPAGPSTAPTDIIAYVPPAPTNSTPIEQGSCWTNSIAATYRTDAWRCSVGNSISDPCFQIPDSKNLLCGVNPAVANATSTFVLQLTQALPVPDVVPQQPPSDWAWLIQLSDGTLCSPFTGTVPFTADGEAASYGCAPGSLGSEVDIFNINSSSSIWTAEIGSLGAAPANSTSSLPVITSSSTVPIVKVWQ